MEYILPTDEYADVTYFSKYHREQMRISIDQNLLISIEREIPFDREYFSLFPELIFIDSTSQTNNERRPLLLIYGKDSRGKCFQF